MLHLITSVFTLVDDNNVLPVIASLCVIAFLLKIIYNKIRPKFSIKVNCWFCKSDTKVPYNSSNCWYCPHCDQYNGFCSDGSYNRILQEQFHEKLNCGAWCVKTKQKLTVSNNGLCRFCNNNLELKVQQLAQFVPFNRENYDEEVQQYSDKLERVYRLCSRCQNVLEKTIIEKQKKFVANQQISFQTSPNSKNQPEGRSRGLVQLGITNALSVGLILTAVPSHVVSDLLTAYPLPDFLLEVTSHWPKGIMTQSVLVSGVVMQLYDCARRHNLAALANMLMWAVLLALSWVLSQYVDEHVNVAHMTAVIGIVLFISSAVEMRRNWLKNKALPRAVHLQKLDGKFASPQGIADQTGAEKLKENCITVTSPCKPNPLNSPVSDHSLSEPSPILTREQSPEDFGFGRLSVGSRRLTRSQTKHFQAKSYKPHQASSDWFRQKTINLSPPKLLFDQNLDSHVPLSRCSSLSSGFVSLSHEKNYEESRTPPSIAADDIDSVSQCAVGPVMPYQLPATYPCSAPFSHFSPFSMVPVNSIPVNSFYQYPNMAMCESTLSVQSVAHRGGWSHLISSTLMCVMFLTVIITQAAISWKLLGQDYFKTKT